MKKHGNELPNDLVTLGDAAKLKGYADSSAINQLIRRGRIQRYEVYGKPLVSRSEVLAYNPDENKGGRPPKAKVGEKVSKKSSKR
jgi:hypothetical protein